MPVGGPMAFLNKKTWHPGNARNQEEVWKREQLFLKELDKQEELRKQIEEEREKEEFDRIAGTATKVKCVLLRALALLPAAPLASPLAPLIDHCALQESRAAGVDVPGWLRSTGGRSKEEGRVSARQAR